MAFLGALSPRAPPGVEQMADADRGQFAADTLGEKSAAPAAEDPAGAAPAGAAQPQDEPAATTGSSTDQLIVELPGVTDVENDLVVSV